MGVKPVCARKGEHAHTPAREREREQGGYKQAFIRAYVIHARVYTCMCNTCRRERERARRIHANIFVPRGGCREVALWVSLGLRGSRAGMRGFRVEGLEFLDVGCGYDAKPEGGRPQGNFRGSECG